ncbi:hypothetical protein B0T22DRAFT_408163 [Podospora appendiculata]|uniref:Mitochondrial inner membrane protein 1 n=1 Tax=Podospora appendiculata TaxID=314037 RepID=A0AAE1CD57_9PEZI|nr:hypothetical protein B0T22DRAFT_408163 [Podospora appendiculata]
MLRTTRPLLGSAQTLTLLTRRVPLAARFPNLSSSLSSNNAHPSPLQPNPSKFGKLAPLILRIEFSTKPPLPPTKGDRNFEQEVAKQKLESDPEHVTTQSSVRHVFEHSQAPKDKEKEVSGGLKGDLQTVKETFALQSVPREPYALGLAGTLPYLGTSVATVFLSWNLNQHLPSGSHFSNALLLSHDTASHWLHLLEPIQVGYGAVIISFLGAIHWGLEYAEKTPSKERTRFRYGMGVLTPIVAWPTLFLPVEWALISQFLSFTMLYFADARATARGWTPGWYGTYRFVLTAIVGAAIFVSLVGRAKVGQQRSRLTSDELQSLLGKQLEPYHNWEREEEEEKKRIRKEKEEQEKKKKAEEKKKKKEERKSKGGENEEGEEKKKKEEEKKSKGGENEEGEEKKSEKKSEERSEVTRP